MKREIKFRAWQDGQMLHQAGLGNYAIARFVGFLYEDAPLMQFAEKKDKNNIDIYEGDVFILPASSTLDEYRHDETLTVVFKNSCFCLENERRSILLSGVQSDSLSLVGNIYQEPELVNAAN